MRNFFVVIAFLLTAINAKAQIDSLDEKKNIISSDILIPLSSIAKIRTIFSHSLTYERLIKKKSSLQLTGFYFQSPYLTKFKNKATQVILEYKYYVSSRKKHKGYFIGEFTSFLARSMSLVEDHQQLNIEQSFIIFGLINGYKHYFNDLSMEFIFGIGYGCKIKSTINSENYFPVRQPFPRGGLNIGYRF